jgi:hypothetical protein
VAAWQNSYQKLTSQAKEEAEALAAREAELAAEAEADKVCWAMTVGDETGAVPRQVGISCTADGILMVGRPVTGKGKAASAEGGYDRYGSRVVLPAATAAKLAAEAEDRSAAAGYRKGWLWQTVRAFEGVRPSVAAL